MALGEHGGQQRRTKIMSKTKQTEQRRCAVPTGSEIPATTHKTEYLTYYPMYSIHRDHAVTRYPTMEALMQDWGDSKTGVVVETITTVSSFQFIPPNVRHEPRPTENK